jgi:hypothetical protein
MSTPSVPKVGTAAHALTALKATVNEGVTEAMRTIAAHVDAAAIIPGKAAAAVAQQKIGELVGLVNKLA